MSTSQLKHKKDYSLIDLQVKRKMCLTLDIEQDYGDLLSEPCYEGLKRIPELVNFCKERNIPLTCFVQGSLLETHPEEIKQLVALDVEFELHSYSHPGVKAINAEFEIRSGKEAYQKFFGKEPLGYRAPLGFVRREDYEILAAEGFKFDSSIFPSLRPGVFKNLGSPTKPYLLHNPKIIEFPFAVFSRFIRIPIGLSYIKLLGKPYLYLLKVSPLSDLIVFGFHLHDLFKLESAGKLSLNGFSPMYKLIFNRIYRRQKDNGLGILDDVISIFRGKGYTFSRLDTIYDSINEAK